MYSNNSIGELYMYYDKYVKECERENKEAKGFIGYVVGALKGEI
jgi:hypothetical protein